MWKKKELPWIPIEKGDINCITQSIHTCTHEKSQTSFVCWFFFFYSSASLITAVVKRQAVKRRQLSQEATSTAHVRWSTWSAQHMEAVAFNVTASEFWYFGINRIRQALGWKELATVISRNTDTFFAHSSPSVCLNAGNSEKPAGKMLQKWTCFVENKMHKMLA